jgi:iron complex outermembrane receptor protein
MIDRENSGGGAYDGKEMPGVPRHAVNLSLTYALNAKTDLTATHAWRSKSFAISDFDNNNAQRQAAFESTSLTFRHKRDSIDYFATLNNLFARKNGLWTGDNTIYPVNYLRSFVVGAKVRF